MRTVLITGGTGLIGSAVSDFLLREGYRVIVLSRKANPAMVAPGTEYAHWDPAHGLLDDHVLLQADWIVHLAGESLATGRWTPEKKEAMMSSRVSGTRLLRQSLARQRHHVKALICASGTSYYGDAGDRLLTETDGAGNGLLAGICVRWEEEASRIRQQGIRVAILRTPPVLAAQSPLLKPLRAFLRLGVAAVPGNGEAWMSWVHLRDIVRIYAQAISEPAFSGTFNAASPFPVTLGQLSTALARVIKGGFTVPVYLPALMIRTVAGEKGSELLKSTRVSAAKLLKTGFEFSFPTIGSALEDLYGKPQTQADGSSIVRR